MIQQEHLPKDRDPNQDQEYGWSLADFIIDNYPYLLAIVLLLLVFWYARYKASKRK